MCSVLEEDYGWLKSPVDLRRVLKFLLCSGRRSSWPRVPALMYANLSSNVLGGTKGRPNSCLPLQIHPILSQVFISPNISYIVIGENRPISLQRSRESSHPSTPADLLPERAMVAATRTTFLVPC